MTDDGFNTTVDCGCTFRLNEQPGLPRTKLGHYWACPQHSAIRDYDPADGSPNYTNDRQIVEIDRLVLT